MTGYFPTMLYMVNLTFGFTAYDSNKSLVKEKMKVPHIYEFSQLLRKSVHGAIPECLSSVFFYYI